ncbi:MAG: hypothetical protein BGO43_13415 [Gammaproteobacteria bacterium 39-13]|nr:hypothetical protein [Gammaproteobacteria bacterium]OJV85724.1 MAG: hypothetical protein BGO43_13415 [Gammaproteobacteria bacterium 39-13]
MKKSVAPATDMETDLSVEIDENEISETDPIAKSTQFTIYGACLGAAMSTLPATFAWLYTVLFSNLDEYQLLSLMAIIPGAALGGGFIGGVTGNYITGGTVKQIVVGAGAYLKHCQTPSKRETSTLEETQEKIQENKSLCRIC